MEHSNQLESEKCRHLATALRLDATRTTIPGFASRLLRGAEDLERHAVVLRDWAPYVY